MIGYLRERWALLVIAIAGMYALYAFFVTPALDRRAMLAAEAQTATDELESVSASVVTGDPSRSPTRIAGLLELGFGKDTPIGQQNHIHALAEESGLRVERVDPDANPTDLDFGPFRLRSREVRVSATGSYEDVASFFTSIDKSPMAVLEEFALRQVEDGRGVRASLTIRTARVARTGETVADGGDG